MSSAPSTPIQTCLDALRAGDPSARAELLRVSRDRLLLMTRKMMNRRRIIRRWAESDDVLQNALLRLHRSLEMVPLDSPLRFLGLAALEIRREIIDLERHYFGPQGVGANHATPDATRPDIALAEAARAPSGDDPAALLAWQEVHEQIAALPDKEREVFDLHWYLGMTQPEVAALLGVSSRTVRRRWQEACVRLGAALRGGGFPA
jgi:RNA polymerase sigma-70 factor (ECF subfamily)